MSKNDAKEFNKRLSSIKFLDNFDKALIQFESLCEKYKSKYPTFINHILNKKIYYFNFIKYPDSIRKHIYTTNIVENFNCRSQIIRINSGGYLQ
jgi:transposase-like protein